jgi:hypothetical protein
MFGWLVYYFYTGWGGARIWPRWSVPIALALHILFRYQEGPLYPRLPTIVNHLAVLLYLGMCLRVLLFLPVLQQVAIFRMGSYTRARFHRRPADGSCW